MGDRAVLAKGDALVTPLTGVPVDVGGVELVGAFPAVLGDEDLHRVGRVQLKRRPKTEPRCGGIVIHLRS